MSLGTKVAGYKNDEIQSPHPFKLMHYSPLVEKGAITDNSHNTAPYTLGCNCAKNCLIVH